jgi:uncharacterized membrane protein YfhO
LGLLVKELKGKSLQRFQLINQWEKISDPEEMFKKLDNAGFPFDQKVFLEEVPDPVPGLLKPKGIVEVIDRSTDEMEIKAELSQPALLVFAENYTEGWEAISFPDSVQKEYSVIPADYILRTVPLSAGKHHFILQYRPILYVVGFWISIFSIVFYLLAIGLLIRRWFIGLRIRHI